MSAYLIAVSHPVSGESPQDLIAYCARVSNPANQENYDTAEKLLTYCIRNKHWSPFEMVSVTFEINRSEEHTSELQSQR